MSERLMHEPEPAYGHEQAQMQDQGRPTMGVDARLYPAFKRVLDVTCAGCALAGFSPLMGVIALVLAAQYRGTPFFRQERPGLNEAPFRLVKFKTMRDDLDKYGRLLPDKDRLTPLGRFLRSTSLDELPQLWNVLKGEMSLVGPRPLLFRYLPLYSPRQRRRHEVKPGITGWAQVNGRNRISWTRKFELDLYYVENRSFALDFRILRMTLVNVLRREGVDQSPERPMQPFDGSN